MVFRAARFPVAPRGFALRRLRVWLTWTLWADGLIAGGSLVPGKGPLDVAREIELYRGGLREIIRFKFWQAGSGDIKQTS